MKPNKPCPVCGQDHPAGALRAATVIIGDDERIFTTYGRKSLCGLADLIARETAAKVRVEVLGGIAEVTQCPPGVDVEIVDHDNEKVGL